MKSLLMSGALAVLVAAPAYGLAPLMTDDFGYGAAAGNLTTLTANWTAHSGAGSLWVGYQTATLSLAGYTFGGTGGAATISSSGAEDIYRSVGGAQTGELYVSALVNISAAGAGTYFLHLKDAGTSDFRARVFARDVTGSLQFGLSVNSSTGTYSTTSFSYNTTYLLVFRYSVPTGTVSLHVLTTLPATEPTPLVSLTDAAPATDNEAVAIRQGSGGPTAVIDGIRVGTTWADLLPVELMNFEVK